MIESAPPKFRALADAIARRIADGDLAEGAALPPERAMAAGHGVAVGTLRRALGDLAAAGLIERRQGSGNYVRRLRGHGGLYGFFRIELRSGGGRPTAEVLTVARHPKPQGAPDFGPSDDAWRIARLRRLDGSPMVLEEIWLDARWAGALTREDLGPSLYHHYRTRLGLRIAGVEDRVGLGRAPEWSAVPGMAPGADCGLVERIAWADTGAPAEWSRSWFDAARAVYVSRIA